MTSARAAARTMADECLCFRSRRVARAFTRVYDEALRPLGIQATQLTLLNVVALSGEEGWTLREVADFLAMDATTLSRTIRPLESAGLVTVGRGPDDGRVRLAVLTAAGARMIARALPLWRRAHRRVTGALGDPSATDLRRRLDAATAAVPGDLPQAGSGSKLHLV